MYWKVEPYHIYETDYCVMPAETEEDHRAALDFAQARIEDGWDQMKPGGKAIVTIELCEGDMPECGFDPDA